MSLSLLTLLLVIVLHLVSPEICHHQLDSINITQFLKTGLINSRGFKINDANGSLSTFSLDNSSTILYFASKSFDGSVLNIPISNCDATGNDTRFRNFLEMTLMRPIPINLNFTISVTTCDGVAHSFIVGPGDFYPNFDQYQDNILTPILNARFPLPLFTPPVWNFDQVTLIQIHSILPLGEVYGLRDMSVSSIESSCTLGDYDLSDAKRKGFIWKKDNSLMLYDEPFRFIAFHGSDHIEVSSLQSIYDTLETYSIFANGTNLVVKLYGILSICEKCNMKLDGSITEATFKRVDYIIATASDFGIRVVVSLMSLYAVLFQASNLNCDKGTRDYFYRSRSCIDMFRRAITLTINRVNTYSKRRYGDDPTIMAWQIGQDLSSLEGSYFFSVAWITEISTLIKSLAPYHLVMDGSTEIESGRFWPHEIMSIATIDIFGHSYNFGTSLNTFRSYNPIGRCKRGSYLAAIYRKIFLVSEIWVNVKTGNLQRFRECFEGCFFANPPTGIHDKVPAFQNTRESIHSGNFSLVSGIFTYTMSNRDESSFAKTKSLFYPGFNVPITDGKSVMRYLRIQALNLDYKIRYGYDKEYTGSPFILPQLREPEIKSISVADFETKISFFGSIGATYYKLHRAISAGSKVVSDRDLKFIALTVNFTEFDPEPPYDDLSKVIASPYDSCPWVIYYRLYACNDEGSLCSIPASTNVILPGTTPIDEELCKPKMTSSQDQTTTRPDYLSHSNTITKDNSGLSQQTLIIAIVSVSGSMIAFVLAITFVNLSFLKRKKGSRQKMQLTGLGNHKDLSQNHSITASNTVSITAIHRGLLSVPGFKCIDINDLQINGVEGKGTTSTILNGRFRVFSASRPNMIAMKLFYYKGYYMGDDKTEDSLATFYRQGLLDSKITDMGEVDLRDLDNNFRYEVALLESLPRHENIIELLGFCVSDTSRCSIRAIIMKKYTCSLKDLIYNKDFEFDTSTLRKTFQDTAAGLAVLHASNILHLDFKPHNVLMEIEREEGINSRWIFNCVITDFGFANVIETEDSVTMVNNNSCDQEQSRRVNLVNGLYEPTRAGLTVRYAAPEIFLNIQNLDHRFNQPIDKKLDVFAWSMSMYETVCRMKPWNGENDIENIQKLVVSGSRPLIPKEIEEHVGSTLGLASIFPLIRNGWSQDNYKRPSMKDIVCNLLQ